ncbi:hypothetical protein WI26_20420 [Burkholderia diffusa]|nr:hypothetical protein WI26_20420 [Burkholderia diffusa]
MADDVGEGLNRARDARSGRAGIPSADVACRCVDRRGHARGDWIARNGARDDEANTGRCCQNCGPRCN